MRAVKSTGLLGLIEGTGILPLLRVLVSDYETRILTYLLAPLPRALPYTSPSGTRITVGPFFLFSWPIPLARNYLI